MAQCVRSSGLRMWLLDVGGGRSAGGLGRRASRAAAAAPVELAAAGRGARAPAHRLAVALVTITRITGRSI